MQEVRSYAEEEELVLDQRTAKGAPNRLFVRGLRRQTRRMIHDRCFGEVVKNLDYDL